METSGTQALTALRGNYPAFAPGEVWLVGAGPGDPGLLTLDALAGLLQADVVVHDALVDARVLALARSGAQLQFAGKRGGKPSIAQEDISAQLVALARRGLRVLRLKGGDPFVFGRGGEEILALAAAGVPFRVVPGVTAGLGGLASACIPATMRGVNQARTARKHSGGRHRFGNLGRSAGTGFDARVHRLRCTHGEFRRAGHCRHRRYRAHTPTTAGSVRTSRA